MFCKTIFTQSKINKIWNYDRISYKIYQNNINSPKNKVGYW